SSTPGGAGWTYPSTSFQNSETVRGLRTSKVIWTVALMRSSDCRWEQGTPVRPGGGPSLEDDPPDPRGQELSANRRGWSGPGGRGSRAARFSRLRPRLPPDRAP